ncbi:hypothetical protein D3C72_810420 [compost metagenome]
MLDRQNRPQIDILRRRQNIVPVADRQDVGQAVIAQHGRQTLCRSLGPRSEQHALALAFQRLGVLGHGGEQIDAVLRTFSREAAAQTPAGVLTRSRRQRRQAAHGATGQGAVPLAFVQIEAARRRGAIGRAALALGGFLARLIGVGRQAPAFGAGLLHLAVEEDRGRIGQEVEQGVEPAVEERQPVLQPLAACALADGGVHGFVARRAEQVQVAATEPRDALGVQQNFRHWQQGDLLQLLGRALGFGVKGADGFQLRPEQVQTHRLVKAGRENVDDAAADGVFATFRHGRGPHIAVGRDVAFQRRRIQIAADAGLEAGPGDGLTRRRALGDGGDGGDDQQGFGVRRIALRQPCQGRHALGRDRGGWTQTVVGQAIPGRIFKNLNVLGEEAKSLNEVARPLIIARDQQADPALPLQPFGDDQRVQPLGRAAQFDVTPRHRLTHQPIPLATSAATCSRMKARMRASIGPSNSGGVGSFSMIQA